ncbi:MAG TPA: NAD(P)-binding domain-containing protein [Thermodesulfobacteriota bacterium]|nr:NAD(P)-binding domain-containing protein [Thermodesulfobacteriota bacterium]
MKKVGFIGFGEVGRTFSREMKEKGVEVFYYDIVDKEPEQGIVFLPLPDLIQMCDIILSTVAAHIALGVAQKVAPFLRSGKTYADMNSTSPSVKIKISQTIEPFHANFIEGAILSAIGEAGAKATILVSGKEAGPFSQQMNRLGLVNLRYLSPNIGDASRVKMIRSVFSKGVECLLLEMLVAGMRAGVAEYVWKDIIDFMTKHAFNRVAQNWIMTHPLACERRYHEMVQVVETLQEIGVDPLITRGTQEFFRRSVEMGLGDQFREKPGNFWDVPHAIEKKLFPKADEEGLD